MNDKAVCGTASDTPGLLNIETVIFSVHCEYQIKDHSTKPVLISCAIQIVQSWGI